MVEFILYGGLFSVVVAGLALAHDSLPRPQTNNAKEALKLWDKGE